MSTEPLVATLARLAAATTSVDAASPLGNCVRLHCIDTLCAMIAGAATSEGRATHKALGRLHGFDDFSRVKSPAAIASVLGACARLTEADDIHIQSCTTPGSVIVAAALGAVADSPACGAGSLSAAIVAGYDVMVALGIAIDGARVVYDKTWPTYFGAAISASVVAGRIIGLDESVLRHAIAIAATMTTGMAGRIAGDPSSRWLTLACGIEHGLAAAFSARAGILGDIDALDAYREHLGIVRLPIDQAPGDAIAMTGLKPYCTGRQSLSATEAFATLLGEENVDPGALQRIVVRAPAQVRAMIDRSARPRTKLESRGIRYQLALAAFYPDELYDVERHTLRGDETRMQALMDRVEVVADDALTRLYPSKWGAIVQVEASGKRIERELHDPSGSPEAPLSLAEVISKARKISSFLPGTIPADQLAKAIEASDPPALLAFVQTECAARQTA